MYEVDPSGLTIRTADSAALTAKSLKFPNKLLLRFGRYRVCSGLIGFRPILICSPRTGALYARKPPSHRWQHAQSRFGLTGFQDQCLEPIAHLPTSQLTRLVPLGISCLRKDAAGLPRTATCSDVAARIASSPFNPARRGNKDNKMANKVTVNRSAVTGKFVTTQYANKHPRTTETEHYKKK